MDSDDAIINTALDELYGLAKKFDVDFVHCGKYYKAPDDTVTTDKNLLKEHSEEKSEAISKPTLVTNDIEERVRDFGAFKFLGFSWNKLIRRNFLLQNDISFPALRSGEDHIFHLYVLCLAKNILRASNAYYVWRKNPNSITHGKLPIDKMIHRWTNSLFQGAKLIEDFMNKFEVLKNKPEYKYAIFDTLIGCHTKVILPIWFQFSAPSLDELIQRELENIGDTKALTAFLFNRMNVLSVNLIQQQQLLQDSQNEIKRLQAQLQQMKNSLQFQNEDIFKL